MITCTSRAIQFQSLNLPLTQNLSVSTSFNKQQIVLAGDIATFSNKQTSVNFPHFGGTKKEAVAAEETSAVTVLGDRKLQNKKGPLLQTPFKEGNPREGFKQWSSSSFWDNITAQLQETRDAIVRFRKDGKTRCYTISPSKNWNIQDQTSTNNPLLLCSMNSDKHIRANNHFVLIEDLKSELKAPHYLILPRPQQNKEHYEDIKDFLTRASQEEKASLQEFMESLATEDHSTNSSSLLFYANVGQHREVPYLHIHFIPKVPIDTTRSHFQTRRRASLPAMSQN